MSSERFEIEPEVVKRESSGCMKGCLIALGIILVLVAVLAYWISQNWRGWTVRVLAHAIEDAMIAANLPEEERGEVRVELQRVFDEFEAGRLTGRQVEIFATEFAQSPLLTYIPVTAIEVGYLRRSGLTDEEKAEGIQSLRRFIRGVAAREIPEEKLDELLVHIADRRPNGDWRLREHATDAELRALLEVAQREADAAEIPEEADVPSPSEELRRIVDQVLAEQREIDAPAEVDEEVLVE